MRNNFYKKNFKNLQRDNKGAALIISLFVLIILFGLTASFALSSIRELTLANRHQNAAAAFWAAEGGISRFVKNTHLLDGGNQNVTIGTYTVNLTKDNSIAHDVSAKYTASRVVLMPASGRGLVAGSSVRPVLELAGITNTVATIHSGSKNGLNNARAAIEALKMLKA